MDNGNSPTFGIVDYCLLAGVLIVSAGIGLFISFIGSKSPEEFLMGNRSFKPLPVAMSLLTSFISPVSLLGLSGESYANGTQLSMMAVGMIFALIFAAHVALPLLFPLRLISINEYIELRFKSKRLYIFMFLLSIIMILPGCGIVLYATTVVLAPITKLSTLTNTFLLGILCTIYSAFGGIKAVIWTDVFQLSVIFSGLIIVLAVGIVESGGIIETLHIASKGDRLQFFNMSFSPFVRHTFINTVLLGFFSFAQLYGTVQVNMQRVCAVKSIKNAKRVLWFNLIGFLFLFFILFSSGLAAYSTYAGCDPMALGIIKRRAQILPFFVMDKMSFIPGLPGIYVATIIGGSLSTLSTVINSTAAIVWKDACLKFDHFKTASASYATFVNKIICK